MHSYRASFIDRTSNVKTSSFKEHASTDMHVHAMHLFKKQQSTNVFECMVSDQLFECPYKMYFDWT